MQIISLVTTWTLQRWRHVLILTKTPQVCAVGQNFWPQLTSVKFHEPVLCVVSRYTKDSAARDGSSLVKAEHFNIERHTL